MVSENAFNRTCAHRCLLIGHRGAAGRAPENTADSLRLALAIGVDAIEIDVRMTRDERLVIVHDETVDRTTNGQGRVRDLSLREIQRLDAGSWFREDLAGQRVLTLAEALVIIRDGGVIPVLEIKEPDTVERMVRDIRKAGLPEHWHAVSFFPKALRALREMVPEITSTFIPDPTQPISEPESDLSALISATLEARADSVAVWCRHASPELVARIRSAGLSVFVLPVNRIEEAERIACLGVHGILSDFPDRVISAVRGASHSRQRGSSS